MKNVFLLGNGFDLHHKLPTKYFDFMCVAEHLINEMLREPLNVGKIFSKCTKSQNIQECYKAHKETFNAIELSFQEVDEITKLLKDNMWYDYFIKTLDVDIGWIDFEEEISTVITVLDDIIDDNENTVYLSNENVLPSFILSNFSFFVETDDIEIYTGADVRIYPDEDFDIKKEYLKEYPHNSDIFVADRKRIFEDLYKQLLDFRKALSLYLAYFVEKAFDLLSNDDTTNMQKVNLLNLADSAITFNYTNTLEKFYSNKSVYHIHGTASNQNIVLGVNPNESDNCGTRDTSLIKFKKYYQREVFGTAEEYIKWYRETIVAKYDYRVITIGHSLDETDKDILSDMFLSAKEIYVTYYDDDCKDDYISNIIKIFGNDGYNKFKKEQGLEFVVLSDIEKLKERIEPPKIEVHYSDGHGKIEVI